MTRLLERGRGALDLGGDRAAPARGPARPRPRAASGSRPVRSAARRRCRRRCGPARRPATGCRAAARAARTARTRSPGPATARAGPRAAPPRARPRSRGPAAIAASTSVAALDQDRLVGELLLERGAGGDQVVGEQPGAGVADVGLDAGGPAGHLGLAAERLELAADLAEQVAEPGQVAVGGVELAERLLLALAVLEDAGGLLDEAAAVLGGRVQDRVELALADDHVHLAADAGVGEQLLDVEQPARSCR